MANLGEIELHSYVKRYTTLASALDILVSQSITLLNPGSWADRNDAYFLRLLEERLKDKSVLALCCTASPERSNHWDTFGPTMDGVCIEFKRDELERALSQGGAIFKQVTYLSNKGLNQVKKLKLEELAFLKRQAYRNEREWRAIKYCDGVGITNAKIAIPLSAINKIYLSPRIPRSVRDSLKKALRSIPGCSGLGIARSSIYDSLTWQKAGRKLAEKS